MSSYASYLAVANVVVPFVTSVLFALGPAPSESVQRLTSFLAGWITWIATVALILWALWAGLPVELDLGNLFVSHGYSFALVFYLDVVSVVFLVTTALLALLVVTYSRVYMHREPGYRRFFSCIFLFWSGLNLLFSAGTLDLIFAGWEVVGVSSFLLIAFYWQRRGPIQSALNAYTVYRFCDLGLLLGAWLNHVLWHQADHLSALSHPDIHAAVAQLNPWLLGLLGSLVILAACGKSAQFPFLFWLPKAMEGPTPSSAIFYGALSVHAGVYLLLRTYAIWSSSTFCVVLVFVLGILTALLGTLCSRVQSNIKAQVAYASAAQVGLQFVELALGWNSLVLVHFVANAAFRCYQLLVSPSIVAYLLRLQGSLSAQLRLVAPRRRFPSGLAATGYVLAMSEGYLESWLRRFLDIPFGLVERAVSYRSRAAALAIAGAATLLWISARQVSDTPLADAISWIASGAAVLAALVAISERRSLAKVWNTAGASGSLAALAVFLQEPQAWTDVLFFLSGWLGFWMSGTWALSRLAQRLPYPDRPFFWGAGNLQPKTALLLVLSFLGLCGFPLSPTFLGEDLLLHHATQAHAWMAGVISLVFVLNAVAIARSLVPLHFNEYVR